MLNGETTTECESTNSTTCIISNLQAYTAYNLSLIAYNQADLSTKANTSNATGVISFVTPTKG